MLFIIMPKALEHKAAVFARRTLTKKEG